jgi:signal transduction histidine kinase
MLVRPWASAVTWRLVGYHALAPFLLIGGGLAVAISWAGTVLAVGAGAGATVIVTAVGLVVAAPWVARGVTRLDVVAARTLLGPSPTEELALRVAALARSRTEVIEAADAERRRIERDLHDGAQQRLVSLAMNLGLARATLTDGPADVRLVIEQAHDEATEALAELRELVRGLHPAVLTDRGLDAALSGIAARAPLPVRVRVAAPRCSPTVEAVAFFVVSEALTNVAKHARASQARVTVDQVADRLRVVVTDDGVGGALEGGGLRGLRQRAASVDGTLTIDSPTGGPTTLTVELPCES